jgi:hypothetical protein
MNLDKPNRYSRDWFEFFHFPIDEARTNRETEFITRCAPLPEFRKAFDVCCGMGRHAPDYAVADICEFEPEPDAFDVAIVMSQSFGYFDAKTNRGVFARLASSVRVGGRIILDLWNPEFFTAITASVNSRPHAEPFKKISALKAIDLLSS